MKSILAGVILSVASIGPAFAEGDLSIPEPGMLGLFAGGVAAILIARHIRRRK